MYSPVSLRPQLLAAMATLLMGTGCSAIEGGAFSDHEESSDFAESSSDERSDGLGASFNRHNVMSDDFFSATFAIDGDGLQQFLETSPYGNRSWLADAEINGERAADAIVAASSAEGINALVMLGRMQVEKSLISKTVRPSQRTVDFAFGCGCLDNQPCFESFRGLDKQISCAAETLSTWYQSSLAGEGEWRQGRTTRSLDPLSVTPENHATASLYSYTPWVLRGRGGNWLVWNITRKFEQHAKSLGILRSAPDLSISPRWSRNSDGSYGFSAQAPQAVQRVVYYTDGIVIAEASRADSSDFAATRVFNSEGPDRPFQARGYAADGTWVAMGNGRLDVTSREAVFIQQADTGTYRIGLERPGSDVSSIRVFADGNALTDLGGGGEGFVIQADFQSLGEQQIEVRLLSAAGQDLRGYQRDLEIR